MCVDICFYDYFYDYDYDYGYGYSYDYDYGYGYGYDYLVEWLRFIKFLLLWIVRWFLVYVVVVEKDFC